MGSRLLFRVSPIKSPAYQIEFWHCPWSCHVSISSTWTQHWYGEWHFKLENGFRIASALGIFVVLRSCNIHFFKTRNNTGFNIASFQLFGHTRMSLCHARARSKDRRNSSAGSATKSGVPSIGLLELIEHSGRTRNVRLSAHFAHSKAFEGRQNGARIMAIPEIAQVHFCFQIYDAIGTPCSTPDVLPIPSGRLELSLIFLTQHRPTNKSQSQVSMDWFRGKKKYRKTPYI